jgi:4-hydroxybenzoate polyprenyltransferase
LGKTILVASAWTAASVGFPVEWDARDLLLSPFGGALFALFAADALLCDLKDGSADARTGVRSAVVLWGQPVTTILAGGLALTGLAAALAVGRLGLAGAGLALAVLAMCPKLVTRPVLGPALVDGALVLPAVLILAGLA